MDSLLQQFAKKESAWRFLKLALKLRASEPAFGYVLIHLANHADGHGVCYPSYKLLMDETGYTSDVTITGALKFWKSAGILTWKKGWGNAHGRKSNVYQFHEDAMVTLLEKQKAERGNLSEESDETSVSLDETSVRGGMKPQLVRSKVSAIERSQLQNAPALNAGAARFSDVDTTAEEGMRQQAHLEETAVSAISSETAVSAISSPVYDIPDALAFDPTELPDHRWGAKRGIGRGLTDAEIVMKNRLNAERVKPQTMIQ